MPLRYTMPRLFGLAFALVWLAFIVPARSSEPRVSLFTLRRVPASVAISYATFQLQAEAWRDFMPARMLDTEPEGAPDGGRPMRVDFNLVRRSDTALPSTPLHAQRVWVLHGKAVWETTEIEQSADVSDGGSMTIRGGPSWTPQSLIDVIVRFVDDNGKTTDLAVRKQAIRASI